VDVVKMTACPTHVESIERLRALAETSVDLLDIGRFQIAQVIAVRRGVSTRDVVVGVHGA